MPTHFGRFQKKRNIGSDRENHSSVLKENLEVHFFHNSNFLKKGTEEETAHLKDQWAEGKGQYKKLLKQQDWLKKYDGKYVAIDRKGKVVLEKEDLQSITIALGSLNFQPYVTRVGSNPIVHVNATLSIAFFAHLSDLQKFVEL